MKATELPKGADRARTCSQDLAIWRSGDLAIGNRQWVGERCAVRGAFSIVELLITVAIVTLLLAVLLPSLSHARQGARRAVCLSNQRQIALAMHAYAADADDRFPIAQYFDAARLANVAWDTVTLPGTPPRVEPGLIWQYTSGGAVQQCPSYEGPSMTAADPYTGYNYNTTYIGRGQGEGPYLGMGEAPARVADVRRPTLAALIGDGGWLSGANKFMRSPLDAGVAEGTVHAGGQAYRHLDATNVLFADGHGQARSERFRKPGALPYNEKLLDYPNNGFLSEDDSAYARR